MQTFMVTLKVIFRSLFPRLDGGFQFWSTVGAPVSLVFAIVAVCTGVLTTPTTAMASGTFSSDRQSSSATLNIRVLIPAILRILEESHPQSLPPADTKSSHISATQRMVLVSTLRKGFCLDLQLTQRQITDWQIRVSGSPGTWIEPSENGYHLCAGRAGRYEVALQHDFSLKDSLRGNVASAIEWPVSLNLSAP
jgi:hypothetical protein